MAMRTLMRSIASATFKNTIRALGAYSLLTMLVTGEVKATRVDDGFFIVPSEGTWTHVVSACAVDEDSSDYQLNGAGVSFPDTATGEIVLRCNVTNIMDPDSPWDTLEVVYRDPDGSGTGNQVTAALHKVGLNGVASLVAAFDSNSTADVTSSTQVRRIELSHDFDFAQNAYHIKIKLKRADGLTTSPAAFIVRLYKHGILGG
jgi:hypothetical protein